MSINSRNGNTLLNGGFFSPCRVATTAAITLSGLQTIDGVTLVDADRVLVKDQADQTTNGIYSASSGNWVRSSDASTNVQFFLGMCVSVAQGTVNDRVIFICTSTDDPVVIDTSDITWASLNVPAVRAINTTSPILGGGDLSADRTLSLLANGIIYALLQQIGASKLLGNPTGAGANASEITLGATLSFVGSALRTIALSGDVTTAANSFATTIAAAAVSYAKIQNVSATSRFLGRITAGAGSTEELTGTQATTLLDAFTSGLKGLAPASGGGTSNFLRADGSWASPGSQSAVLLATLTASNSATLSDTTSLTNAYNRYLIVFQDIVPVTANVICRLRVNVAGVQTSGYLGTAFSINPGGTATESITTYVPCTASNASNNEPTNSVGVNGFLYLQDPSNAGTKHTFNGQFGYYNGTNMTTLTTSSMYNTAGAVTGIEVSMSSGNINSGTVKIYGLV